MAFWRPRGFIWPALLLALCLVYFLVPRDPSTPLFPLLHDRPAQAPVTGWRTPSDDTYFWRTLTTAFPPSTVRPLPTNAPLAFPPVQAEFPPETTSARSLRESRRAAVKDVFAKCWASYREHAWLADELSPVSAARKNPFGGWAATLVDSLDTLWIMGLHDDFAEAVDSAVDIDFTTTSLKEVNVFETTIRYLGGFLAAYDLSRDVRLLRKAVEVGEMLYKAFDTPNRMPITRWDFAAAAHGRNQSAGKGVLVAEIGSLSLELTRLSQLTGDARFFDAAQRITDRLAAQQDSTALPGLWPLVVNPHDDIFHAGSAFTLGAMADSLYEYLPKMAALTQGRLPEYRTMYDKAVAAAAEHLIFRPMTPSNADILLSGSANAQGDSTTLEPQGQHLVCFLGGMLALGGKLFARPDDMAMARRLVDGCVWAYDASPRRIMPETFTVVPCPRTSACRWDETEWKRHVLRRAKAEDTDADAVIARDRLPSGFTSIPDRRYILRPEAIESVFVLHRTTASPDLLESAWAMFDAINSTTATALANSAVWDVMLPKEQPVDFADSMESFWLGETLKYFYLIFSEPDLISLDDYVFNTEAHPFRRWR